MAIRQVFILHLFLADSNRAGRPPTHWLGTSTSHSIRWQDAKMERWVGNRTQCWERTRAKTVLLHQSKASPCWTEWSWLESKAEVFLQNEPILQNNMVHISTTFSVAPLGKQQSAYNANVYRPGHSLNRTPGHPANIINTVAGFILKLTCIKSSHFNFQSYSASSHWWGEKNSLKRKTGKENPLC